MFSLFSLREKEVSYYHPLCCDWWYNEMCVNDNLPGEIGDVDRCSNPHRRQLLASGGNLEKRM